MQLIYLWRYTHSNPNCIFLRHIGELGGHLSQSTNKTQVKMNNTLHYNLCLDMLNIMNNQTDPEVSPLAQYMPQSTTPKYVKPIFLVGVLIVFITIAGITVKKAFFSPRENSQNNVANVYPTSEPTLSLTKEPNQISPCALISPMKNQLSWQTYSNESLGISFKYPKDWNLSLNKTTVQMGPKTGIYQKTGGISLEITAVPLSLESTYIDKEMTRLAQDQLPPEICRNGDLTLSQFFLPYGMKGSYLTTIESSKSGFRMQLMDMDLKPQYDAIIRSFSFLPSKITPAPTSSISISKENALEKLKLFPEVTEFAKESSSSSLIFFRDDSDNNRWVFRFLDPGFLRAETLGFYFINKTTGKIDKFDPEEFLNKYSPIIPPFPTSAPSLTPSPVPTRIGKFDSVEGWNRYIDLSIPENFSSGWTEFLHTKNGISVKYPSDFTIKAFPGFNNEDPKTQDGFDLTRKTQNTYLQVRIIKEVKNPNVSLKEYVNSKLDLDQQNGKSVPNFPLENIIKETTIGGKKAIYTSNDLRNKTYWDLVDVYIEKNNSEVLQIIGSTDKPDDAEDLTLFYQIVSTLKFSF